MPASAADRQRRRRERIRNQRTLVRVELSFDDVETLVECGHLPAWDEGDPDAIAVAILLLIRRSRVTLRRRGAA